MPEFSRVETRVDVFLSSCILIMTEPASPRSPEFCIFIFDEGRNEHEEVLDCRNGRNFDNGGCGCTDISQWFSFRECLSYTGTGQCWSQCQPERTNTQWLRECRHLCRRKCKCLTRA